VPKQAGTVHHNRPCLFYLEPGAQTNIMTGRENRKARREAERKARKLEQKQAPLSTAAPAPNFITRPTALEAESERQLEAEFGKDFLAHSRALSNRMVQRAAQRSSFRNTPAPTAPGRSTGPRTPEGKATSSRNSLKHGLSTGTLLIPGEDPAAFASLREALHQEHQPANTTEQLLVDDLAQSHWLRQRAIRLQNECFTADGGVDEKRLSLFLRYGTTHERAFHKALAALLRLQKERRKSAPPAVEFVSKNRPATPQFVSQTAASLPAKLEFVSQMPDFGISDRPIGY
jgi:hypothetical protein